MNHRPDPIADRPASRAEALRRSLLDSEALPENEQVLQVRASRWSDTLRPENDFQVWLVGQVADLSFRVDRCARSERRLRDRASLRAEVCWEDDRSRQAEAIGGKLAARPAESVGRLRETAAGCDWLIRRWALLARAADLAGLWSADQASLAFDLLATPAEFRDGRPGQIIDAQGRVIDQADDLAAVARGQIDALQARRDRLAGVEQGDRALVMAGLFDDPCPEIGRLRRHEASLQRRIRWCLAQLRSTSEDPKAAPEVKPDRLPEAPPVPARPSRPMIPWEIDEFPEVDIDPIALRESRREIRAQVAEFRRQEARRLETLGS